jgi:hypothetical protein
MARSRGWAAARENELLQWRQVLIELIETILQACYVRLIDDAMAGNGELTTQIEQFVLYLQQQVLQRFGQACDPEHHPKRTVGFIDGAARLDARMCLGHARAISQPGAAVITRACIDLGESMAHGKPPDEMQCQGRAVA